MSCHRCHGCMCPADLFVGASGNGHDGVCGWRCVACGEIIDLVIVQNCLLAMDLYSVMATAPIASHSMTSAWQPIVRRPSRRH
jgi:hypothetical protein